MNRPMCGWRRASWTYIINEALSALIPWRLLHFGNKHFGWCWASCVTFKFGPLYFWRDGDSLKVRESCFEGHPEPWDYCGQYQRPDEHPCFASVVKRRQCEFATADPVKVGGKRA